MPGAGCDVMIRVSTSLLRHSLVTLAFVCLGPGLHTDRDRPPDFRMKVPENQQITPDIYPRTRQKLNLEFTFSSGVNRHTILSL